jgi:hypothetical protein
MLANQTRNTKEGQALGWETCNEISTYVARLEPGQLGSRGIGGSLTVFLPLLTFLLFSQLLLREPRNIQGRVSLKDQGINKTDMYHAPSFSQLVRQTIPFPIHPFSIRTFERQLPVQRSTRKRVTATYLRCRRVRVGSSLAAFF